MFRPERFLDNVGNIVRDEHMIPFSIGRRQCLGEKLAKVREKEFEHRNCIEEKVCIKNLGCNFFHKFFDPSVKINFNPISLGMP